MPSINFTKDALSDYIDWQNEDKKTLKRINRLLVALSRGDEQMTGKPEALKYDLSGLYSLRIDETNRLVYGIEMDVITVYQLKGHYD